MWKGAPEGQRDPEDVPAQPQLGVARPRHDGRRDEARRRRGAQERRRRRAAGRDAGGPAVRDDVRGRAGERRPDRDGGRGDDGQGAGGQRQARVPLLTVTLRPSGLASLIQDAELDSFSVVSCEQKKMLFLSSFIEQFRLGLGACGYATFKERNMIFEIIVLKNRKCPPLSKSDFSCSAKLLDMQTTEIHRLIYFSSFRWVNFGVFSLFSPWRGCGSIGHNTLSWGAFRPTFLPIENLQGNRLFFKKIQSYPGRDLNLGPWGLDLKVLGQQSNCPKVYAYQYQQRVRYQNFRQDFQKIVPPAHSLEAEFTSNVSFNSYVLS